MRIIGLGVDLADISRIERVLSRYPRFARRCFTAHEREYARRFTRPSRRYAARFAGKEAVMKSLGTGYRRVRWTDIEITGGGKPTVNLAGTAAARAGQPGVTHIEVAITTPTPRPLVFESARRALRRPGRNGGMTGSHSDPGPGPRGFTSRRQVEPFVGSTTLGPAPTGSPC